jgi:hypothetical protein
MLRARARAFDTAVSIAFEPASGDLAEALELEAFVPPTSGSTVAAG